MRYASHSIDEVNRRVVSIGILRECGAGLEINCFVRDPPSGDGSVQEQSLLSISWPVALRCKKDRA